MLCRVFALMQFCHQHEEKYIPVSLLVQRMRNTQNTPGLYLQLEPKSSHAKMRSANAQVTYRCVNKNGWIDCCFKPCSLEVVCYVALLWQQLTDTLGNFPPFLAYIIFLLSTELLTCFIRQVTNFLNFWLSERLSPSLLKDNFTGYIILCW